MAKKNNQRKAELTARSKSESLIFQTMWGARQKMGEVNDDVEQRINEEIMVLNNMGLAEDILTLKNALDSLRRDLNIVSEPSKREFGIRKLSKNLVISLLFRNFTV